MPYLSLKCSWRRPLRHSASLIRSPLLWVIVPLLVLVVVAQNDVISLLLLSPCVPLFLAAAGIRAVSPPKAFYFVLAYFAFGKNTCKGLSCATT